MADSDRRQAAAGHNNRKRRQRDDDDFYDRRQQRRRTDSAPVPVRLRRQLLALADSPLRQWGAEVQAVARLLHDNADDEKLSESFVNLSMQLAAEQPLKTPFVAAVVLVVNTLKPDVVEAVLARLARDIDSSIGAGEWRRVKLLLKLLACLQPCLEGDGVFPLLEELFGRAADLQTASSDDTIGTEIVKIILLTIPYAMASAPGLFRQKAADLMEKTDIIASEPHALQALVDPFHPEGDDDASPTASNNLCMLLQKQLQAEAANNWELACLPRPWQFALEDIEMQDKLGEAPKHALPAINVPQTVVAGPRPLFPEVYFSVYADQEIESVPGPSNIAASLIRDGLVDTLNVLDFNRNAVARYLMDLDCYFADGTFVKRATPFDELRNFPDGRATWKPEDVAVDTVFSQLFLLPNPDCKVVYYHSVLTEACKLAPAAIAPSLGRAIRYLYRNSPRMDLELSHRFLEWFAHHLSNFGFTWKWAEWAEDAQLSDLHPRKWFLLGAMDKEVRLSFAQRIRKTLPEAYQPLIGEDKDKDVPDFKFSDAETPFSAEGQEMGALLKRKGSDDDIQAVMDRIQALASEQGVDPVVANADVFMTTICWVGSKSLSHVLACIDRTKGRLVEVGAASPAARAQIITAVMTYWAAHPGVALSILEKLLNYSIISPISIVDWALVAASPCGGADGGHSLAKPHVLELVRNTVAKVSGRVREVLTSADAETREKEMQSMRDLLGAINAALAVWAAEDRDADVMDDGEGGAMIRRWASRWMRVFGRVAAIEEAFMVEAGKGNDMVTDGDDEIL
ncbi:cap binding protein [Ophiocordyceps camponoti-floridani]|uniref:Cap binding protein n=1 Tax=Ophiocordyceps camponoti-floridani TaxID=2030778 RepID=A0A8H4QCJ8_9HYPO|nr:cap binding protein [Ophiocordyceps camponoti-floridani]